MTIPLTRERKQAAIQRAKDRVRACEAAFDNAFWLSWHNPDNITYERREIAAQRDLDAAREKLERIIKEYGE